MTVETNFHIIRAIAGAIARPSATFKTISNDPDRYLASSVAIFAAVCLVSAMPFTDVWFGQVDDAFRGLDGGVEAYARSLVSTVLQNFVIIAVIFWVGSRYGGNRKFRNVFPVLSYCLISVMVWSVVVAAGTQFANELLGFAYDDRPSAEITLSPSFALDFAGGFAPLIIPYALVASLMAWFFVLFVKAIKASHGFGTRKSIGVLVLAAGAAYALVVASGILQSLLWPPVWH